MLSLVPGSPVIVDGRPALYVRPSTDGEHIVAFPTLGTSLLEWVSADEILAA